MQKGDELSRRSLEWFFVNEFHAGVGGAFKLRRYVGGSERDVVNAFAILLQKFCDGAVRRRGLEQFQVDFSDREKRGAHFLRSNFLAVFAAQSERFFVVGDGLVERADRDAEVVNFGDHVREKMGLPILRTEYVATRALPLRIDCRMVSVL
jgi:hypothetical protein